MFKFGWLAFAVLFFLPTAQAESYVVVERYSGKVLLADGSEFKQPVGSLSQLAAAKLAMDWAKMSSTSTSVMLTVPSQVEIFGGVGSLQLQPGDQLSLRDALYATLLISDQQACWTLAHHVGSQVLIQRQIGGDPMATFVAEMNKLARSLWMKRTRFATPHGNEQNDRSAYSTASDMARLSVHLAKDSGFAFYVKQKQRSITVTKADGRKLTYTIKNTNKFLGTEYNIVGTKYDQSPLTGACYSLTADHEAYVENLPGGLSRATPVQMIVVVLAGSDTKQRAHEMIKQGWQQYELWRSLGYLASADRHEFLALPPGK